MRARVCGDRSKIKLQDIVRPSGKIVYNTRWSRRKILKNPHPTHERLTQNHRSATVSYMPESATFTFLVGYTTQRPIIPDERHAFITYAGEDTPSSFEDAKIGAQQMASTHAVMVTSCTLIEVSL